MKVSEVLIGKTLLFGVLLSALIVLWGGTLYLIQHGSEAYINPVFSKAQGLLSFHSLWMGVLQLEPRSIILFGLGILLITQLARVLLTAWFFLQRKEKFYFWTSIFVFGVLLYSILKGIW